MEFHFATIHRLPFLLALRLSPCLYHHLACSCPHRFLPCGTWCTPASPGALQLHSTSEPGHLVLKAAPSLRPHPHPHPHRYPSSQKNMPHRPSLTTPSAPAVRALISEWPSRLPPSLRPNWRHSCSCSFAAHRPRVSGPLRSCNRRDMPSLPHMRTP